MTPSRRKFLKIAGTSAVIVAAGAGSYAATRTPHDALAPWSAAGNGETPLMKALSYAVLAPNPHNRQPWLIDLKGADEGVLYCEPERRLPITDPEDRQITIGLGCFLEILRIAAAEFGYRADITPFPDGEPSPRLDQRPVAHIKLVAEAPGKDPLFAQIPHRRSNKEPYDAERAVPAELAEKIRVGAGQKVTAVTVMDESGTAKLRDLTWQAFEMEMRTPAALQESIDLMRIGRTEIEANPDGIDLGGLKLELLSLVGVLNRESMADPASAAFAEGIKMYRPVIETSKGFLVIRTKGNSRREQLDAGAAYVRANLRATGTGISMHPLSQILQEYKEMDALYRVGHDLLAPEGGRVQMLARLGYGQTLAPSPRWPAATRIRS
ncbi:MAG: twin-arginine translocation pathway signal protein [Pseudomonadota bacterium]